VDSPQADWARATYPTHRDREIEVNSRAIGELAVDTPLLPGDTTCDVVREVFQADPHRGAVLLHGPDGPWLVDRNTFLAGTHQDDDACIARRAAGELADRAPLALPHDMDLLDAASHVLERDGDAQYEDVIVTGPGDLLRLVPVSRMLAELTRLYRHQARHDVLTGLANRILVVEQLTAMRSAAQRHGGIVAVLFIDLDDFKDVNDTYGHQVGDRLLMGVAQRLRDAARTHDVVGRLGGDEFVVAATLPSADHLHALTSRIIEALEEPFLLTIGPAVRVRGSVGVATDDGTRTSDELLRLADRAMYTAKDDPDTRVVYAQGAADASSLVTEEPVIIDLLRHALDDGRLQLAYQPVVSLQDRLPAARRGACPPPDDHQRDDPTTPVHRRGGAGRPDRAAGSPDPAPGPGALAAWDRALGDASPPALAFNLSCQQSRSPRIVDMIADVLEDTNTDPKRVWVEIPERADVLDDPSLERTLTNLQSLGIRVSVDDFGVGDATLGRLARLPLDELKIDRSLVAGCVTEVAQRQVVRMVIGMAKELGLSVVAEGVETNEQVRLLRLLDCPAAQGYRFGRPMPADDLPHHLALANA
jgi:diguanylate cyclase (GGDEF)-like protein